MQVNKAYVGRFAPSPTGPLHFGSLVAALASYLDAKHHKGRWLLRIEDIDPPREDPDAPRHIIEQLQYFGLHWDDQPLYQSTRLNAYDEALRRLKQQRRVFACNCSRKSFGAIYPGTCRDKTSVSEPFALRLKVEDRSLTFDDIFIGPQSFHLQEEIGDFILKRKDGLVAYQLAVVADDEFQGVTHVIRGHDLLDSTPRQIFLAEQLGYRPPEYGHFPVVLGSDGTKLSKQARAEPVALTTPHSTLNRALLALGQPAVQAGDIKTLLAEATTRWQRQSIPKLAGIPLTSLPL